MFGTKTIVETPALRTYNNNFACQGTFKQNLLWNIWILVRICDSMAFDGLVCCLINHLIKTMRNKGFGVVWVLWRYSIVYHSTGVFSYNVSKTLGMWNNNHISNVHYIHFFISNHEKLKIVSVWKNPLWN